MKKGHMLLSLMLFGPILVGPSSAQQYPTKPIRIVVPYPAGGLVDTLARTLGPRLQTSLGQPVIVDNRPGANGMIGWQLVVNAPPDGYTLLFDDKFTQTQQLQLIAYAGTSDYAFLVPSQLPVGSVREFINYAKQNPGRLNYGSAGTGSRSDEAAAMFTTEQQLRVTAVPYKGLAPALTDLIGNQVNFVFAPLASALPHVKSGRLKVLATTGARRSALTPEIPTLLESNVSRLQYEVPYVIQAPSGTPKAIENRIRGAVAGINNDRSFQEPIIALGVMWRPDAVGTPGNIECTEGKRKCPNGACIPKDDKCS